MHTYNKVHDMRTHYTIIKAKTYRIILLIVFTQELGQNNANSYFNYSKSGLLKV
jgi:hypothetical protein